MGKNENEQSPSSGDEVEGEDVREIIRLLHLWGSGGSTGRGDTADNFSQDGSPK